MVQYASGSVRITGLGSDYNFDEMIDKLYQVESRQATQFLRWKSDWQARLDAFREVRSSLVTMQSALKNLNSMSKFLVKSSVSTQEGVATARADADAMNSNYNVVVNRLAANGVWTKDTGLAAGSDVISASGGSLTYSYQGNDRTITVPQGTTVDGLLKLINNDSKNLGVRAQVLQSADGIIFQLRGMDTGRDNTLVLRSTSGLTGLDVTLQGGNYAETYNSAVFATQFAGASDIINSTGESKTFVYSIDGTRRTVTLADGATIGDLVGQINAQTPGVASLDLDSGTGLYNFTLKKDNTVYSADFSLAGVPSGSVPNALQDILGIPDGAGGWITTPTAYGGPNSPILAAGSPSVTYSLTLASSDGSPPDGETRSVTVTDTTTLSELASSLQSQFGSTAEVKIVQDATDPSKYNLKVEMIEKSHRLTIGNGSLANFSYEPPTAATGSGWDVRQAENAQVRINGYPNEPGKWLEVASNNLESGEVVPGMSFTLLAVGETNIGVSDDIDAMRDSIYAFVDAVNAFRATVNALTAIDDEKEVLDPSYAESQFEMQKGGLLTGNYGIQMVASRLKDSMAATGVGFSARTVGADGSMIGDVFSALSQIGISTNAVQGEADYGLLTINFTGDKGSMTLDEALAKDPQAVARLFAIQAEGRSNSDYFQFDSMIPGITKAGSYEISYKVASDGTIYDAYIDGYAATIDPTHHTLTSITGPAKGMVVSVTEFSTAGEYSGTVGIQQGKIPELLSLLEGNEGILGNNGTLKNLENSYQEIIDGIDDKIQREDERLQKWENNMLLKFARLEATLAKYNQIQSDLESQIAQLGTSSSS
ncbi:MAG: flagellar filament capping protein FliD [Desulfovibrio sp.]|jgi:flagellar hook-associated protein 2|nr:flagellar filament capping protein FliD [Desulfovibrio sp.]